MGRKKKKNKKEEIIEEPRESFEESLSTYRAEGHGEKSKALMSKEKTNRIFVLFFSVILVISLSWIIKNLYDKYQSEIIYDNLSKIFSSGEGEEVKSLFAPLPSEKKLQVIPVSSELISSGYKENKDGDSHLAELRKMRASLESLKKINPDIYCWIRIPGTRIDYPVAKSDRDGYYLDHSYTGENLTNGCIFVDGETSDNIAENKNTVLCGHNIQTGAMFHDITAFFDEKTFRNNLIYLYSFDGIFIYKAISVYETEYDSGFNRTEFRDDDSFLLYGHTLLGKSEVEPQKHLKSSDRLLTLYTCTNGVQTQRYTLHAVLVESITDSADEGK